MARSRWSKQTREKCGWNSEKLREERRAELVSIFKYFIPPTNQRTSRRKNCSYQNVCKKMGVGGFYTLVMSVWLCEREGSVDANCQNWPIIWTGISEYGIKNNAYKHSFLSLPGPLAVFAQLFSICFPCYLAAWNRLNASLSPRDLSMVAGLLFWARVMDRSWTLSLYLSLTNCQLYRCSLKAHPLQEGFLYFANLWVSLACAWHISISVTSSGTTTNPKNICAVKQ